MGKTNTKSNKDKSSTKAKSPAAKAKSSGDGKKGADQAIMEALATFLQRGNEAPERSKVAKVTKLADKTIANALTKLKRKNYVVIEGKTLRLTQEGKDFLGPLAEKAGGGATNEEVHDNLKKDMKKKEVELFDALIDGKVHDKQEIAEALAYKDGKKTKTFMNMTAAMKTKGIVHYPEGKNTIQLVLDTCFPWGLDN